MTYKSKSPNRISDSFKTNPKVNYYIKNNNGISTKISNLNHNNNTSNYSNIKSNTQNTSKNNSTHKTNNYLGNSTHKRKMIIPLKSSNNSKKTESMSVEREEDYIRTKEQNLKLLSEKKHTASEMIKMQKELEDKDKLIQDLSNEIIVKENNQPVVYNNNVGNSTGAAAAVDINFNNNLNNKGIKVLEKTKESQLISNLKKQNRELQSLVKLKEEEINKLKKHVKVTKINELNDQLYIYHDEMLKLKGLTYDLANEKTILENKIKEQDNIIKNTKQSLKIEQDKNEILIEEINILKSFETNFEINKNIDKNDIKNVEKVSKLKNCQKQKELNYNQEIEIKSLKDEIDKINKENSEYKSNNLVLLNEYNKLKEHLMLLNNNKEDKKMTKKRSLKINTPNKIDIVKNKIENQKTIDSTINFSVNNIYKIDNEEKMQINDLLQAMIKAINIQQYKDFENIIFDEKEINDSTYKSIDFSKIISKRIFDLLNL